MKYCQYSLSVGDDTQHGVCHKSKIEYLLVPGASLSATMIDDEEHAKLVDSWGGVEIAPAKAKKTK